MEEPIFPQPIKYQADCFPLLGAYFFNEIIKQIDNAKIGIYSVQYQWKWNIYERHSKVQQLGDAIIRAKKRNVEIKVILNQESPNRNLSKINGITCNQLACAGVQVKMLRTPSLLHTKLWIFDSEYSVIGSHNISGRSLSINEEASVLIQDKHFAIFMQTYFNNLWEIR